MNVLLVEDEPRIAAFLIKGLNGRGYGVDHASAGAEALRRLGDGSCHDLVLLDLGLPDLDGLEVLRRLRARRITLPVIVITARGHDREEGTRSGADAYLVKPVALAHLLERVRTLAA